MTLLLTVVVACDKGPIQEHRIQYRHSGFGGEDANVEVDLDRRTVVRHDHQHVAQATLSEADAKLIGDLASCARDEKVDPVPKFDDNTRLVLDGDRRREIDHGGSRATAPCAAKLEERLEALAVSSPP